MNAIVKRCLYAKFRPTRIRIIVFAYILLLLFILWMKWLGKYQPPDLSRILSSWSATLFFIQYLLVFIGGFFLSSQELYEEKLQNTFIFFHSLPLTPIEKLKGMIIGSNLTNLLLILITGLISGISGIISGISLKGIIATYIILIPGMLLSSLLGLLYGLISTKVSKPSTILILFIILAPFLFPFSHLGFLENPFILLFPFFYYPLCFVNREIMLPTISFFGLKLWLPIYAGFMYLYFAYWVACASIRKIENEEFFLLSPKEAIVFLLLTELIFAGFMWDTYSSSLDKLISFKGLTILSLFFTLLITSLFVKDYKAYFLTLSEKKKFDLLSPLFLGVLFWIYLFLLSLLSFWIPFRELSFNNLLLYFTRLGLFLALFISVIEFFAIGLKKSGKIWGFLVVIILCVAPLILFGISDNIIFMAAVPGGDFLNITGFIYPSLGIAIFRLFLIKRRKEIIKMRINT